MKRTIAALVLVAAFVFFAQAYRQDTRRNHELETATDPARIAYLVLDYTDAGAQSTAFLDGGSVVVQYNLDPWFVSADSARTAFLLQAQELIPLLFNHIASASAVVVAASVGFSDIRGHQLRGKALEMRFSRLNADRINWRYVRKEDLPRIADAYWEHPGFR